MEQETQENPIRRFWNWLKGDSFGSWIVSLILAFVIVKYIFFPTLSFLLATSLPLVVVESASMHHPAAQGVAGVGAAIGISDFQKWWDEKGSWYTGHSISEQEVQSWPFENGLEKGDIMVVSGRGKTPEIGDVIIFNAGQAHPIIHRIVNIENINGNVIYSTKGDNNDEQLSIEREIPKDTLVGKAVFRIPKLGWVKLIFVNLINAVKGN